jgi:cell division protein ZapA
MEDPKPAPAKKPVKVNIFNQSITILTSDDPAEVERLAQIVDDLMRAVARSGNIDTVRAAVLACLHLADRLSAIERDLESLRSRVDEKSRRLSSLLDQVMD